MPAAATKTVVVDASVLINLIHAGRLPLLAEFEGISFVVTDQTVEEITEPTQAAALGAATEGKLVRQESSLDPVELKIDSDLRTMLGKGEASSLAMAQARGWIVACDERGKFLREARARVGDDRVLDTPGLILNAIRRGLITVAEADALKAHLETCRFKLTFKSFADLL